MNNDLNDAAFRGLESCLELLRADLLNTMQSAGKVPGSHTISEMVVTKTATGVQLQLPGFLPILETGRAPTSKNAPAGDPPMITRIRNWCREKGIPDNKAWAIKKTIDKNGFKGKPGLLSEPLSNENIALRITPFLDRLAMNISSQIISSL